MQNILITGGNSGIGKATAIGLASNGNRIIILSRNQTKINKAIIEIKNISDNSEIYGLKGDLSSFESIRRSAKEFKNKFGKLDILINNAGLVTDKLQFTKDGFELQIGVNHLGHFLFTGELINLLTASVNPRIINVSSNAHFKGAINFNTFKGEIGHQKFNGMAAYGQSKLANVLFTKELARKYPKIISHSLHPGVVKTNITNKNENGWLWKSIWSIFKPLMLTPQKGARTSIYLAQSNEVLGVNGRYYNRLKEIEPSKLACDQVLAEKLWEVSKKLVA